jgi:hypothetical protein
MYVAFLHGPLASGKHTIGLHLSGMTGLPLFHNHVAVDAALTLFPFGSNAFKRMRASVWLTAFCEAAESGQSFIFTFCPEATVEPTLVEQMTQAVVARGGKVVFIELTCSRAVVLERLCSESRTKFGKLTDPQLFAQIESQGGFEFPALPAPFMSVNTEHLSPEVSAQTIAHALSALK